MTLQVVGTGFGRTATNSLKLALEQLGFGPCHHMFEVFKFPEVLLPIWKRAVHQGITPDWDLVFKDFKSTVDWPSAFYWKELVDYCPRAKVIHSTRSPESWVESVHNTIYKSMAERNDKQGAARELSTMAWELIVLKTFNGRMDDPDYAAEIFRKHDEEVMAYVAPERLLVFQATDGWQPLCAHLGVPVPDAPFPRTNTTEVYEKERAQRQADLAEKTVDE